jgi:hypothetical protein
VQQHELVQLCVVGVDCSAGMGEHTELPQGKVMAEKHRRLLRTEVLKVVSTKCWVGPIARLEDWK